MQTARVSTAYEEESRVAEEDGGTVIRLAPNLLRDPANLRGEIVDPLLFRDALLSVGDVAASKLHRSREEIRDAILDPLVTVTQDDVYYEAFSLDESTYVRLSMREGALREDDARRSGCTNVDFSDRLRLGLSRLRRKNAVGLHVGRRGIAIESGGRVTKESKVELPVSWMYGFVEVQAALRSPSETLVLDPTDLRNVLAFLSKRKARQSPRALRLLLHPGEKPRAILQPWDQEFTLRRSSYLGASATEVLVWGRRRLLLLDRTLPHSQRVVVSLQGSGRPSFWSCDLGTSNVLLGLSAWTAREWSVASAPQSLATPCVDEADPGAVDEELRGGLRSAEALAGALAWPVARVDAALSRLCAEGRVLYDPDHEKYCPRRVFAEGESPPDVDRSR